MIQVLVEEPLFTYGEICSSYFTGFKTVPYIFNIVPYGAFILKSEQISPYEKSTIGWWKESKAINPLTWPMDYLCGSDLCIMPNNETWNVSYTLRKGHYMSWLEIHSSMSMSAKKNI